MYNLAIVQILVIIIVFYDFPKLSKEKFLNIRNIFLVSKNYKSNQILHFWMFIVFHNLSFFISVRAFLPSLRVLKTSQDKDEITRMVRIIREI